MESATLTGDEVTSTPYGAVEIQHNHLTDASSQKLFDAMDFQRASQSHMWAHPMVSMTTREVIASAATVR